MPNRYNPCANCWLSITLTKLLRCNRYKLVLGEHEPCRQSLHRLYFNSYICNADSDGFNVQNTKILCGFNVCYTLKTDRCGFYMRYTTIFACYKRMRPKRTKNLIGHGH